MVNSVNNSLSSIDRYTFARILQCTNFLRIVLFLSVFLLCWQFSIPAAWADNPVQSLKAIDYGNITVKLQDVVQIPVEKDKSPKTRINYLYHAGDGSQRLFVNDMRGKIYIIKNNQLSPDPFLNLKDLLGLKLLNQEFELGLGGFAFHPDYALIEQPGYGKFYTVHSLRKPSSANILSLELNTHLKRKIHHYDVITEWSVSKTNPDRINNMSAREVLRIAQPWWDNNTGHLSFNPNSSQGDLDYGMLYISVGDGGDTSIHKLAIDEDNHAQNLQTPLGSILRINPLQDKGLNYRIPDDNPFLNQKKVLSMIWAYGLRNPQRFSWDTGDSQKMFIVDIGQDNIEEVNEGKAGANYGWSIKEGKNLVNRSNQKELLVDESIAMASKLVDPVAQYGHKEGQAISGGFVYRGKNIPELYGAYVFGDIANGRIFYVPIQQLNLGKQSTIKQLKLIYKGEETDILKILGGTLRADLRFGLDQENELYILTKQDGFIRKLVHKATIDPGLVVIETEENKDAVDGKSTNQLDAENNSDTADEPMTQLGKVIIAVVVLLVFGLLFYLNRSSLISIDDSELDEGEQEIRRYDSVISLCSLCLDINKKEIRVNFGKKQSQISFDDIDSIDLLINAKTQLSLSRKEASSFNAASKRSLRRKCKEIEKQRLSRGEARELAIKINAVSGSDFGSVGINFYCRQGSLRMSKQPYVESVETILSWFTLLDSAIHSKASQTKPEKKTSKVEVSTQPEVQKEGKPSTKKQMSHIEHNDMVDELAKLSDLKAQGYLSEEEFNRAKAKIFNG